MNNTSFPCVIVFGLLVGMPIISGCAGSGQVFNLHVHAIPATAPGLASEQARQLTVLVQPFQDRRPQREVLGSRTHFWGGLTHFNVEDGRAGDVVAGVLADYLKQKGWAARFGPAGDVRGELSPDVIISGEVREFTAKAKSRFGSTLMTTNLEVTLKANNTANGTSTTMRVDEQQEESVFWFDREDLEGLVNQTLQESLQRAMVDLEVTAGALRLK